MIDLGLAKLAMIGAVALIVIGPEKLPKVARMAGTLLGRAQRYLNQVKAEVSREIELDELRKMQKDVQEAATDLKASVGEELKGVEQGVNSINSIWQPPPVEPDFPQPTILARKARSFRRQKLQRNAAVPGWYKQQQGTRSRLLSASARVAKYRPKTSN